MKKLGKLIDNYDIYLLILLCSSFYNSLYYHPFNITKNWFFMIAALWAGFIIIINLKKKEYSEKSFKWACLFFISFFVSTLLNISGLNTESFVNLYVTAMFVFSVYFHGIQIDKILKVLIAINFLFSIISLLMFVLNIYYTSQFVVIGYDGVRLYGIYNNPNTLGTIAGLSFFLSLYFIKNKQSIKFYTINCVLMLIMLFLSHSRNAALFFCITLIIYCFFMIFKNLTMEKRLTFILAGFLLVVLVIVASITNETLYSLLNQLSSNRLRIWKDSLEIFLHRPIFGFGVSSLFNQFCNVMQQNQHIICLDYITSGHNLLVDLLFMGGITGLATFIVFLINCLSQLNESFSLELLIVLLYILFVSMLDYGILFSNSLIALVFWIVLSIGKEKKR